MNQLLQGVLGRKPRQKKKNGMRKWLKQTAIGKRLKGHVLARRISAEPELQGISNFLG